MNRFNRLLCIFFFLSTALVNAQEIPKPPATPALVNDFAQLLNTDQRNRLEQKLEAYNDSTSTEITIVTVTTLDGDQISDFTFKLANEWGVGKSGKDNGIVILVAPNERKAFIATGYGVEANITDVHAYRVVDQILVPHFRRSEYYEGLDLAVDRLMQLIRGEFDAEPTENKMPRSMAFLFIILFIIIIIVISRRGGGGNHGRGYHPTTLGNPYRGGSSWGNFNSGSGSFGGGFGGFGGGSFGGGGAGGSW